MIKSHIIYFGKSVIVSCDGKCNKAFGASFSDNNNDEEAPVDPGTYEGGQGKPTSLDQAHNKWCVRECERSEIGGENHE